jgi:tellurite resistance protein TehA-like permease
MIPVPAAVPSRFVLAMRDTSRRTLWFAAAAIPGHLLMAGSKAALLLVTPSLFVLANVLFPLGLAGVKTLVLLADRRRPDGAGSGPDDGAAVIRRAYRACGLVLVLMAASYGACCLALVLGAVESPRYEQTVAIGIAALAFAELGVAAHGAVASRRGEDLLREIVKLSNLAGALVLIVLAQTALLSMTESDADISLATGLCGLLVATATAGIGLVMLLRRLRPARPPTANPREKA